MPESYRVISGSIKTTHKVRGALSNPSSISGKVTMSGRSVLPYTGDYTVTPQAEAVVIPAKGMLMKEDLVIDPIPSNYGLITWNGSFIRVS